MPPTAEADLVTNSRDGSCNRQPKRILPGQLERKVGVQIPGSKGQQCLMEDDCGRHLKQGKVRDIKKSFYLFCKVSRIRLIITNCIFIKS